MIATAIETTDLQHQDRRKSDLGKNSGTFGPRLNQARSSKVHQYVVDQTHAQSSKGGVV